MNDSVCFRRAFVFDPAEWPGIRGLKLTLDSKMPSVEAWLNGKPLQLPPTGKGEVKLQSDQLKKGRNVLAVRVAPSEGQEKADKVSEKDIQRVTYGANLFPRPDSDDEVLKKSELGHLGLFRQLRKMPGVEEYPKSIVLRKYSAGDVICYQGEPGNSAFYILSTEDLYRLRCSQVVFQSPELKSIKPADLTAEKLNEIWEQLQSGLRQLEHEDGRDTILRLSDTFQDRQQELIHDLQIVEDQLIPLVDRIQLLKTREDRLLDEQKTGPLKDAEGTANPSLQSKLREDRRTATVHIIPGANRVVQPKSVFSRITQKLFGGGGTPLDQSPKSIRNDGPSDVDYATRQAPMYEGDLFGEMACMTNAPRSATITADGEVYMLEFLKNVFNLIQKDEGYRLQILQKFRERVLSTHLDRLEFFQELSPVQKATLSDALDLKIVDAGTVIFNEEEPSDCVYIIRTGLVQVVKGIRGVHVAINKDAVTDWPSFAREMLKGDPGVEIPCPSCGHLLRLLDRKFLGLHSRCPECQHRFILEDPKETRAKQEIQLTSADSYKKNETEASREKTPLPGDKLAALKAKLAKKKSSGAAPEVLGETPPPGDKLAALKAKLAKKKSATPETAAAAETPPTDKLAALKAKLAKKKSATPETAAAAETPPTDKLAALKAKMAKKKSTAGEDSPAKPQEKVAALKAGPTSVKKEAASGAAAALLAKKAAKKSSGSAGQTSPHDYQKAIWNALPERAQNAIRRVALGESQPQDEMQILVALNDLIKSRDLVEHKVLAPLIANEKAIATYPRNKKQWTGLQICVAGRLILQGVYPQQLKKPADDQEAGPIRILAYLSSGDILGEMGVVQHALRTATCIAWDHPAGDEGRNREPGQVHLISIKAEAFDKLMKDPVLAERVKEMIDARHQADSRFSDEPIWQENSIISSPEFQDRGFVQGQKLMLIDLDSCTRCGDCVRACIETHDDGYSRLFLDGPRFDRFLVPSACRNCIDPACMIGCPVGSIQKGDGGQIVIRDWCIGCEKCAKQCPYDSIQMHDTGVIPSRSPGWKYQVETAVKGLNWYESRYKDDSWADGIAPFQWDLDFHANLNSQKEAVAKPCSQGIETPQPEERSRFLQYRDTVLEVRLDVDKLPPLPPGQESFDMEKLRIKALPAVAVVCDQCATRKNSTPACVEHCPHEAAMRINARMEFPIGM